MTETTAAREKCKGCGREIDVCEFCEQPGCPTAVCYACENRELKPVLPHPHSHGG